MQIADIFVGSVSVVLGVAALAIAAANWGPGFQFWIGHAIDSRSGRTATRIVYAVVGIALVALGMAIMLGFAPNARRQSSAAEPRPAIFARSLDQMTRMH